MIERNPHPVFAGLWALWGVATIYFFVSGISDTQWAFWFTGFLVVEIVGVFYRSDHNERDTLSETMTWLQRHLSKHRIVGRGWNAALLGAVLIVAWVGTAPITNRFQATVVGILIAVWLHDHWLNPDVHG